MELITVKNNTMTHVGNMIHDTAHNLLVIDFKLIEIKRVMAYKFKPAEQVKAIVEKNIELISEERAKLCRLLDSYYKIAYPIEKYAKLIAIKFAKYVSELQDSDAKNEDELFNEFLRQRDA